MWLLQDLKICVAKHFVYHKTVAHLGIHNIFFTSSVYRHLIFFYQCSNKNVPQHFNITNVVRQSI